MNITTISELERVIADVTKTKDMKYIMVDGWTGVGKSTIVLPILTKATGFKVIDGDEDFLIKNVGTYVFNKATIDKVFKNMTKIIIDSVLCLKIAEIAHIKPDLLIYVKSVNKNHEWIHYHIVDPRSTLEKLTNYYTDGFEQQLIRYHRHYKPQDNANYTVETYEPFNDEYGVVPEMFYE